MNDQAPLIAAIDLGTNSFHMVIASVNQRGMLDIKSRDKEMVRLGRSHKDMKRLHPDAIERGVETLKNFVKIAKSEFAQIRAVATSAVREASNQKEFRDRVKEATGINIEVISGAEEGRLIYQGIIHSLPVFDKTTLLIDIGGGSTETVVGLSGNIKYVHSEKIGAIRLTKGFFPNGISNPYRVEECRDFIKGAWSPTMKRLKECNLETVVGTSGTIQNIALMALAAKNVDIPDITNGLKVSAKEMLKTIEKIVSTKTPEERLNIKGMDPKRADIIVGGALIIEHALKTLDIKDIVISSYALREGIVFDTYSKMKSIKEHRNLNNLRYETILNLCQRYNVEMIHSRHVKEIALAIYDDLQSMHKQPADTREMLEAAALLHDVGYHISHDQHHKHSYYIIKNSVMPGFTNNESDLIANIAPLPQEKPPEEKT